MKSWKQAWRDCVLHQWGVDRPHYDAKQGIKSLLANQDLAVCDAALKSNYI